MSKTTKDYIYDNLDVFDYVPDYLKNRLNSSFSRNLFNKLLTKEESITMYGLVGDATTNPEDKRPFIAQNSTERKINSLIPMVVAKDGIDDVVLSFSDIINKAKLLGINTAEFADWGSCKSFNFAPPIDVDKFINFSSYFWYGNLSKSQFKPEWNETLEPEYYVISKPKASDQNKLPVEVSNTGPVVLTGCGMVQEDWIITFTSPTAFTVAGTATGPGWSGTVDSLFANPFVSFKISAGTIPFVAGDKFTLTVYQIKDTYTVSYTGSGNGAISGVKGQLGFQIIDGIQTYEGQRVLVKNQYGAGIYIVQVGDWIRAEDCDSDADVVNGVKVFVTQGSQAGLYEAAPSALNSLAFAPAANSYRNISEWTEFNFWAHRDDLEVMGIDVNKTIQAKRPIIEYHLGIEMTTDSVDGKPVGGNSSFNAIQRKFKFNQLPLFNTYLPNGDFAGKISPIFYYEEDATSGIDAFIKRRIKLDSNNDFIFSQGCIDEDGKTLFFKRDGVLSSIWHAGEIVRPRYVTGENATTAIDIPVDAEMTDGVWKTPFQLEFNPYHENRKSVHFGDLINHFKDVISSQDGLIGSPFGRNNFRNLPSQDLGVGGNIKEHNGVFNRFVSLVNQENISPVSILDFAETQYAQALNSVNEYVNNSLLEFISAHGTPDFNGQYDLSGRVRALFSEYKAHYKSRVDVGSYLSSSTSVIPNWPATLPTLGLAPLAMPRFDFDNELGLNVIVHHDGHLSPKNQRNPEFERALTRLSVTRSDGSSTPGIFAAFAPSLPYKNQLWFNNDSGRLYCYNVSSDSDEPASPAIGDFWYQRGSDLLRKWTASNTWEVVADKTIPWTLVETEKILNELVLTIETALYESVHQFQTAKWDTSTGYSDADLAFELAKFAAKYGYDQYAPDFVAEDPFTWNYKEADFPLIGTGHARWHDVYKRYFAAAGVQETCRPNLEPWKLFGYFDEPAGFSAAYEGLRTYDPSKSLIAVDVLCLDPISNFSGCPNVVDGTQLSVGSRVLVLEPADQTKAGLYIVRSVGAGANGVWEYAPDFNPQDLELGQNVLVNSGSAWAQTIWVISDTSAITFTQVRMWAMQMWIDLLTNNPSLKPCVNIFNEQLLPPYVVDSSAAAPMALLITLPTGIDKPYAFGDNGPTESVWKKSLEHSYSLLRCGLKNQPLNFLESTWGDAYRSVNGFKIDKQEGKKLSHKDFLLHGEAISTKIRAGIIAAPLLSYGGNSDKKVELVCDLISDSTDFFQVNVDGEFKGYLHQVGLVDGIDFTNFKLTDEGFGFEIGDKMTFTVKQGGAIADFVFEPAKNKTFMGLCQYFTQLLQFNSYSLTSSFNSIMFREWDVKLGHRFGAFVKTEALSLSTDFFDVPLGLCKMVTKVSPYSANSWLHALRIQLVQVGSTVLEDGIYKPAGNGDDWTFRIETYFDRFPKITYYKLDPNGSYQTFFALEKRRTSHEWVHPLDVLDTETSTVPFTIKGVQNVVNFLFGYIMYLEDQGWKINQDDTPDIDAETGRSVTWQLEVEKFVDAAYDNMAAGNGVIINPFLAHVWFQVPKGLVAKFQTINFLDVTASQFAFDVLGNQISLDSLKVIREEDMTTIMSDIPMFGLHVNVENYEHAVLFPYYLNNAKREKLLYDPFLGMKVKRILINGKRQAIASGRPSFGGFYLNNHEMKRNIVASIDDLGRIYDAESAFDNPDISKYALALFGYQRKDYFKELGVSDKTQFNFWRGMIQAKGTNMAVDAFLNNQAYQDAKIDEYWAFKIAEYGDARTKSYPELKLRVSDCLLDYTRFQFNDGTSIVPELPGFIQISTVDEDRWVNLDDLNELKERGMYFDAISLGKVIIKEKPAFGEIEMLGNGILKFESTPVVKTFMSPTVIQLTMTDLDNFVVVDQTTNQALGTGTIDVEFNTPDFSFTVIRGFIEPVIGDSFELPITDSINALVKLPFIADQIKFSEDSTIVEMVTSSIARVKKANTPITVEGFGPQKPKFSPIKFFDYSSDTKLGDISFWHPAIGQHTPEAYEVLNVISPADPAKYNQTTQILDNPNYDVLKPWGPKEVGKVWWDNFQLDYVPYYDPTVYPDLESRLSKWGSLAEYSTMNVYEWVESDVPPSEYNAKVLSDAEDQNIPQAEKKSGEVAQAKLLTRSRTWDVRPVAWKMNEAAGDSPFFTSALFNKIRITGETIGESRAILNYGRFADYSITAGMSISAWNKLSEIPVGQATVTGTTDYVIGAEYEFLSPAVVQPASGGTLSVDVSNKTSAIGKAVGKIAMSSYEENGVFYVQATEINTGKSQAIPVSNVTAGTPFVEYDFTELGFKFRLDLE